MCVAMECAPSRVLFLFLLSCLGAFHGASAANSCPAALSNGQPACAESLDAGSHTPDPVRSRHVGNPVDIVSGNKYQSEIDVRLGGSALSLVRHYNSVNAAENLGLGNGWRHTYSVSLVASGNDVRRITQSDGRIIEFSLRGPRYQSLNENDGYVLRQSDNKHTWHLQDGRVLSFHGSFLTEISSSNGGLLTLFYRRNRLHSVTDEMGRSLVFSYAPGRVGLPAYEPNEEHGPSGHLLAIRLPDGSDIQYRYNDRQNLVAVDYPRAVQNSTGYRYRYDDAMDSRLLTERSTSYGKVLARWKYDSAGRVVSYRSGFHIRPDGREQGAPDISLAYAAGDAAGSGTTTVAYRNGALTEYEWLLDVDSRVVELTEEHTEPPRAETRPHQQREPQPTQGVEQPLPSYANDALTIVDVDELGYPSRIHYQVAGEVEAHELNVSYSLVGKLLDVDWRKGLVPEVNTDRRITRAEFSSFASIHWKAGTRLHDVLSAATRVGFLEIDAKTFLRDSTKALDPGTIIHYGDLREPWISDSSGNASQPSGARSRANWRSGETTACLFDSLTDCRVILQARDYAELSACAYVDSPCNSRFFEANLAQLGLDWSDLVHRSFRAGIYYDRENDVYIVTFAGTDFNSLGDWISNAQQEFGEQAFQYQHAVNLAQQLARQNSDLTFVFTGHSLGGGLATAAAAATSSEAIVFNPAALDPDTATNYSFDFTNAEYNTDVFSVDGELLNHLQNEFDFTNEAPGTVHTLPRPNFDWVQAQVGNNPLWAYNTRLGLALHGMNAVMQSLSELIQRHNCV